MYRQEAKVDWQVFGGVEWSLDGADLRSVVDEGHLVIRPAANPKEVYAPGQLPSNSKRDKFFFPWSWSFAVGSVVVEDEVFATGSLCCMFSDCCCLKSLVFPGVFDTSQVTDMKCMFRDCSHLTSLTLPESLDTSHVTNMTCMFARCNRLELLALPESFDTSRVTNMKRMFEECNNLESLTLPESLDTSHVTDMRLMFVDCNRLTSLNLPESFNASRVTDLGYMFRGCKNLETMVLPSSFNVSQKACTEMMFSGCPDHIRFDSAGRNPRWVFSLIRALDEGDAPSGLRSGFIEHLMSDYSPDDFDSDAFGYKSCLEAIFAGVPFDDVFV